jgi:beta-lactamase class A
MRLAPLMSIVHSSLSACLVGGLLMNATASAASSKALEAEIAQLSKESGGVVGVAAWMLDGKGPRVLVNASERFPMASTFKIAVAGTVLAGVDAGRLQLNQMIAINPDVFVPSEVIADRFIHPGVSLSVHNLLELMLTESDNTATDVLTHLAGGPAAVTDWLRRQGVKDQRIDRDTAGLLRDFFGLPPGPFAQAIAASGQDDAAMEEKGSHSNPSFDDDPRDTSSPEAMAQLLTKIFSGGALSPSSTQELMEIMKRCRTGEGRLKGRLPAGTVVAHKTGTIGGTVNDVGAITLPSDAGQVVIAVFIKKSDLPYEKRERVIAEIARSVRDYYLFARAQ